MKRVSYALPTRFLAHHPNSRDSVEELGDTLGREQRLPRLLQGAVTVDVPVERRGGDAQAAGHCTRAGGLVTQRRHRHP